VLRVLTYHRVSEPEEYPHLSPSVLSATPGAFREQMRFVASAYTPVSIQTVLDCLDTGKPLPPRAVLITFDDAYQCFERYAWGTLKELGVPVVLFVATAFPDDPTRCFWWDRLYHALLTTHEKRITSLDVCLPLRTTADRVHAHKALRAQVKSLPHEDAMQLVDRLCSQLQVTDCADNNVLGWSALKQLAAEGVNLGAHTRTHPLLSQISEAEAEEEAVGSLCDLRQQVGNVLPILAYPSGGATPKIATRLRRAGFRMAFTTTRGPNRIGHADPLLLKRNNVSRNTSLNLMRVQLLTISPFGAASGTTRPSVWSET
jgi:peptidoglycan/xylan/chitin deacetylase (PgdA/CDA1 family)